MKSNRKKQYAIMCEENNDDMWSNEFGWVDTPTFDLFSESQKATLSLPIGGLWVVMTDEPEEGADYERL